jgi:hypothetical protein
LLVNRVIPYAWIPKLADSSPAAYGATELEFPAQYLLAEVEEGDQPESSRKTEKEGAVVPGSGVRQGGDLLEHRANRSEVLFTAP